MAPEIETDRLRLRYWREDDWQPLSRFFAEPKETNIMGGVSDAGFAWRVVACHAGHWQWRGYGMWAVEQKSNSALAGFCGPWYPADWPELELGWSLLADFRGRGLATEAATAARQCIYSNLGVTTVVSYIEPNNMRSIAVAERLDCALEGETTLPSGAPGSRLSSSAGSGGPALTTLQTDRLILRPWCLEDFEPLAAFLADGKANRYRGAGRALTREEAWQFLCEKIGEWQLRGTGEFAVERRDNGQLIGWAGLWHPIQLDEPELAWSLFTAAQGQGFATEAATRVMRWAAEDLGLPPLFSFVHPDNTPSRKVAERLGATLEANTEFRGAPRLIYRHRDLKSVNSNLSNQPEKELTCQS